MYLLGAERGGLEAVRVQPILIVLRSTVPLDLRPASLLVLALIRMSF